VQLDRNGIAFRIRALIGAERLADVGDVASSLGIDEVSLRMSIDELAPYPTVDVIAAVVAHFGIDPTWLLSGDYDPATHRSTGDAADASLQDVIRGIVSRRSSTGSNNIQIQ
jgi:hypothetical protein